MHECSRRAALGLLPSFSELRSERTSALPVLRAEDARRSLTVDISTTNSLEAAAVDWLDVADRLRGSTLPGAPLALQLINARARFETHWLDAGLATRRAADQTALRRALAQTIRSYRFQEDGNPERPNALKWADEMVSHFREAGDSHALTEALLEKAAIYLELSQLNHTDTARFALISRDGDRLLQDCYSIAGAEQRPEVLRIWSRFYYNLARPSSGRLSERWDDRFLALADEKIDGALALQPDALRNLNQKARVTQRRARNTLDAPRQDWADRLWDIFRRFSTAWRATEALLNRPEDRISPMNVLAILALDAVAYQLAVLDGRGRMAEAGRLLHTIDEVALPVQRQAWAMVRNTNLARAYGFDTVYDLARLHALRAVLVGLLGTGRQNEDIDAAAKMLAEAREAATVRQLDASRESLNGDVVFIWLPDYARVRLQNILDGR